jgi:hypothetical protein
MLQDFENAVEHAAQEARAAAAGTEGQEAVEPAAGEAAKPADL